MANIIKCIVIAVFVMFISTNQAQDYGSTDFHATGDKEAHAAFTIGLLKMHNFEFEDARASFQEAIEIDSDFTMAYWGEALSYEQSFWRRYETEKSRAVLSRLGDTPEARAAKAVTQREKDYLATVEILFGEGEQREREESYSVALKDLSEKYPDDLDAKALYALSILVTTYGGRDYARYMRAGAITEEIMDVNPRHPGGLHYNIHSYDDPIHGPLGLRAARLYDKVAPSAVHALHMVSHIYYSLGMWEEGVDRNIRSYDEAVKRLASPDDLYGHQAFHSLTWVPYAFQQMGENAKALEYIAKISKQVEQYGEEHAVTRENFAKVRAAYIVDTQEWDSELADVKISHKGLSDYAHATDIYTNGLIAINRGDLEQARVELGKMEGDMMGDAMEGMGNMPGMVMTSGKRSDVAPGLYRLALQGQIALAESDNETAVELISQAEQIEGALPSEYGPAVPVQPMAELLADVYAQIGDKELAREYYELSLSRAVGRIRSVNGLNTLENSNASIASGE